MNLLPKVSVILPVYNGEKYLKQSIDSILSQTYRNYELLIIDDGSIDNSLSTIKSIRDNRIKVFTQSNQGLAATLNRGIRLSKGEYLARQDQDDISLPDRFDKQVRYLNAHSKCGMVGTWAKIINENGKFLKRYHKHPIENDILKLELLFNNPFVHSSVMMRKNVFKTIDGYSTNDKWQPPEDYELWSRLSQKFDVANIPEVLHIYREVSNSISRVGFKENVIKISARNLGWLLKKKYTGPNVYNIAVIKHGELNMLKDRINLFEINDNLNKIINLYKKNKKSGECIKRLREIKKQIAVNILRYYRNLFIRSVRYYLNYN
jgi:glycosyltransferase involved in cell wall biosynthesis